MVGWSEVDTAGWDVIGVEPRGKRPKQWVRSPEGVRWLRKDPRKRSGQASPYEPAIEWLALRLATASDVPAVEAHPCVRTSRDTGNVLHPATSTVGKASEAPILVRQLRGPHLMAPPAMKEAVEHCGDRGVRTYSSSAS